jgi:hypothetical protein
LDQNGETITPERFADHFGISRTTVFDYIRAEREPGGGPSRRTAFEHWEPPVSAPPATGTAPPPQPPSVRRRTEADDLAAAMRASRDTFALEQRAIHDTPGASSSLQRTSFQNQQPPVGAPPAAPQRGDGLSSDPSRHYRPQVAEAAAPQGGHGLSSNQSRYYRTPAERAAQRSMPPPAAGPGGGRSVQQPPHAPPPYTSASAASQRRSAGTAVSSQQESLPLPQEPPRFPAPIENFFEPTPGGGPARVSRDGENQLVGLMHLGAQNRDLATQFPVSESKLREIRRRRGIPAQPVGPGWPHSQAIPDLPRPVPNFFTTGFRVSEDGRAQVREALQRLGTVDQNGVPITEERIANHFRIDPSVVREIRIQQIEASGLTFMPQPR